MSPDRTASDFDRLADEFWEDGSLEKYLAIRHAFPGADVGGIDLGRWTGKSLDDALLRHNIAPATLRAALEGDQLAVDQLAVQVIEALVAKRGLKRAGKPHPVARHGAIAGGLVNYLIVVLNEACQYHEFPPPASLGYLTRQQLDCWKSEVRDKLQAEERKRQAILIASGLFKPGERPSLRKIAKQMSVDPGTVSRWFKKGELEREVKRLQHVFPSASEISGQSEKRRHR